MRNHGANLLLALALIAALPAAAHDARPVTGPRAVVLGPDEGEALVAADGRKVLLKSTAEANGARELFMGSEELPGGTRIPMHRHDGYEEIIFVHAGRPTLSIGDQRIVAEPGSTLFIPAGTLHGVEAEARAAATILFVFPETDLGHFFRNVFHQPGGPAPELGDAQWKELSIRHRMRSH